MLVPPALSFQKTYRRCLDQLDQTHKVKVEVVLVSSSTICGARTVTEGSQDFPACALPVFDHADLSSCQTFTHRGKDSKGQPTVYMPWTGTGMVLAIKVAAGAKSAKPKVFSRPTIPLSSFPDEYITDERVAMLTSMTMVPRIWKVLFEGYEGPDWLIALVIGGDASPALLSPTRVVGDAPPAINIPSPRVGEGGY